MPQLCSPQFPVEEDSVTIPKCLAQGRGQAQIPSSVGGRLVPISTAVHTVPKVQADGLQTRMGQTIPQAELLGRSKAPRTYN